MPYIKKKEADNLRKQIIAVRRSNGDWRGVAIALGVKKATAYRWVKNQDEQVRQRGGRRRIKIEEGHKNSMVQYIEENPRITLSGMREKIQINYGIIVSTECLRKHLDGLMFTLKDVRREPERMNSEENKTKRSEYVMQLLNFQSENIPIIYLDETNFNLFISRRQGRSKKGRRCSYIAAGSRGANIHVIGCIGNMGLIHHEVRRGSFRKQEANDFVRAVLRAASNLYQSNVVLVIDNAPCHADIEAVFQEEEFNCHHLLRLSPYSPMLNPIELAWSSFKAGVKRDLAVELPDISLGEERANITQTEFRATFLENIIQRNLPTMQM